MQNKVVIETPEQENQLQIQSEEIYEKFINYEWNEISQQLEKSILKGIAEAIKTTPNITFLPTPEKVSYFLESATGINLYEKSRKRDIIEHRALLCHILRFKLNMRWETISRFVESKGKNYDHATAIHAAKMYPIYKKSRFNYFENLESNFVIKNPSEYNHIPNIEILKKEFKSLEKNYKKELEKNKKLKEQFSKYTTNEKNYRKLNKNQKEIFDERAAIIIKSFEWKQNNSEYEIINCAT